jgi:putative DNA methylase
MITGGVCSAYGLETWGHLFTDRQLVGLTALTLLVGEARNLVLQNAKSSNNFAGNEGDELPLEEGGRGARAYADAVAAYLAFAVDRLAMTGNSLVRWNPVGQKAQHSFGRQAMPMVWDYAEPNLFGGATGSLDTAFKLTANGIGFQVDRSVGSAIQADAPKNNYPIRPVMISTDPPYYDNIAYADLSDFFYVWLRRSCSEFFPQMFRRLLTPKAEELVATPFRFGSKDAAESFFLNGMSDALSAMRAAANETDPLTVYYAFKQAEAKSGNVVSPGWAAFLQAIVDSGLQVDGTWPVRTEMATRQVAAGSNALAASVILVCRKRPNESSATSRREFLRELKPVMDRTIRDHQKAGIPLPDRRQAAIGPGIGVFSRYSIVREADDSAMRVATALALINKEIDALLAEGTEELDAETRFALEWYQLNGYSKKTAGQHNLIGQLQGLNLTEKHINATGLFLAKGGDAKLLSRDEMHESELERYGKPWRPSIDDNFTVWELAQHMARTLGALDGGIDAAGRLLAERRSATTDVLLIAERLFELATARGENEEALVWNELQTSWPEIENAADRAEESGIRAAPVQGQLGI